MIVRLGTWADLEAMTAVLIAASPLDPVYPYRFPDRHLYPAEFAAVCRQKCAEYLETSTVVVCELPVDAYGSASEVVAFSAWDLPPAAQPAKAARRSSSAFRAALAEHKQTLFDARYGGHVFLRILLTHPRHQRRGAGTALASWGVGRARALGAYATVFASPMGLRLYRRLGFREVGRCRIRVEGEAETLDLPALARPPGPTGAMREATDGVAAKLDGLVCGRRVSECAVGGWDGRDGRDGSTVCA
ncbi:acyl-CoA N-acyltransferase [Thermothelomyces heterothallicus CBS 202.75]|uniref:acyl-CoA N-acyltransferase n=1 Tax=Thermothelomyces heterothallicus CBS 202.75 TaxID=1149848 RepID=UPI003741EAF7